MTAKNDIIQNDLYFELLTRAREELKIGGSVEKAAVLAQMATAQALLVFSNQMMYIVDAIREGKDG